MVYSPPRETAAVTGYVPGYGGTGYSGQRGIRFSNPQPTPADALLSGRAIQPQTWELVSLRGQTLRVIVRGEVPRWFRPVATDFRRVLRLPENWDSYGGQPISVEVVAQALAFLVSTMAINTPPPAIVPTSEGGVQLEWHARGIDLEVEFGTAGLPFASITDSVRGEAWDTTAGWSEPRIAEVLAELSRRQPIPPATTGE